MKNLINDDFCENTNNQTSISEILNFILELQKDAKNSNRDYKNCDRPRSGSLNNGVFNTRPINLYICCSGSLWTMPYELNGVTASSTVFKVFKVDDDCATFEILAPNPDNSTGLIPYLGTNNFFTINLKCVLAIRCLNDTYTE